MNTPKITDINSTINNKKSYTYSSNLIFFVLLTVKSFEILHKYNGYASIFETFALN